MAYEMILLRDGTWAVDWELIRTILRSYTRAKAMHEHSRIEITDGGWFGPDLHTLEVDWARVKRTADAEIKQLVGAFSHLAHQSSMHAGKMMLATLMRETKRHQEAFRARQKSAHTTSMANCQRSIERAETGLAAAKLIRDLSVGAFMVGATILTGGGAAAVGAGLVGRKVALAAGEAAIKTAVDVQDTAGQTKSPYSRAVFSFFGEFSVALIPGGSGGKRVALAVFKTSAEGAVAGGKALVGGDEAGKALQQAAIGSVTSGLGFGVDRALGSVAGKRLARNVAFPLASRIKYATANSARNQVRTAVTASRNMSGLAAKTLTGRGVGAATASDSEFQRRQDTARSGLLEASIADLEMLRQAIQGPNGCRAF
jgi:hypothetical protein